MSKVSQFLSMKSSRMNTHNNPTLTSRCPHHQWERSLMFKIKILECNTSSLTVNSNIANQSGSTTRLCDVQLLLNVINASTKDQPKFSTICVEQLGWHFWCAFLGGFFAFSHGSAAVFLAVFLILKMLNTSAVIAILLWRSTMRLAD